MIIKDREPKIFDEEPSKLTLEQAKNFYDVPIYEKEPYDTGVGKVLEAGAESFITSIKKMPSQLQMATGQLQYSQGEKIKSDVEFLNKVLPEGGRIYNGNKTVEFGDELMETGKLNIQTANRNLETLNRELEQNMPNLSPEDRESLLLASVPALGDFGVMLALSYVNPSLGLGYMGLRTFGAETEEGAEVYKAKQFEKSIKENQELLKNMTPEERKKALEEMMSKSIEGFEGKSVEEIRLNLANTAVQTILEKAFGVPSNLKRLTKHKELLKRLFLGGVEELVTENTQNITDAIFAQIGDRLAEDETIFSRFMSDLKYTVIAAAMGGATGAAFAINSRARGIEQIENLLVGTDVDQSKINQYATVLYDSAVDNLQGIVSKELELDSSLKAKHGEVYNNLVKQMKLQIDATGALEGKSELQKAQYISQTAKEQADLLLGESFKRNTTIDNVWKATEAVFRDGRLYLQGKIEKPKATRKPRQYNPERMELLTYLKYMGGLKDVGGDLKAMDAGKLKIGLINNKSGRSLDDAMLNAWESGYFPEFVERPTVDDLLEAVRDSLSGKKRYRESFRPVIEQREAKAKGLLAEAENENLFDNLLSARFTYDELKDMPLDVKEKLYVEMVDQINAISDEDYIQQEINSLTEDELERYAIMTENGATHDEAMQEIINNRTPEEYLYFQFAGTKAKTANLEKLNIAKQLELEGVSGEDIRKQTGWFKGVDGKWRFEISDNDAEVVLLDEFKQTLTRNIDRAWDEKDKESLQEKLLNLNSKTIYKTMAEQDVRYSYYLGDILKHDKLYQAYPFLRNIMVRFSKMHENLGASVSYYDNNAMSGLIEINLTSKHFKYSDLKKVLMHEVQHIIQREEKFARGGSQEEYDDYVKYVKSEYDRFKTGLFMSFIKDEFSVDIHYTHAIKIMDDIFRGDRENKKYIYEENKIDRSELIKAVNKKVDELSQKEQNYRDEKYKRIPKNSYEFYLRLAGELEARITEEREGLTDEQRLIEPIEEKRNKIKNADAIVVFDDGGTYAYNNESISSGEYYQTEVIERTVNNFTDRSNPTDISEDSGTNVRLGNIYLQSAFAGSRVDYDTPSLEAIGSGEGAQVHGWGLYYALSKDVAEGYRSRFLGFDEITVKNQARVKEIINSKGADFYKKNLSDLMGLIKENKDLNVKINELSDKIENLEYQNYVSKNGEPESYTFDFKPNKDLYKTKDSKLLEKEQNALISKNNEVSKRISEIRDIFDELSDLTYNLINNEEEIGWMREVIDNIDNQGQVHEVDIPENPYLLDEQEMLIDQSDFVQRKIEQANKELDLGIEDSGITGDRIYQKISDKLGSDKSASQYLDNLGIKGITYYGRQDGRCFVIFNPANVKVIQKFYQKSKKQNKIKGAFDKLTKSIEITSEADYSTYKHEFAHFWLDNIWNYANSGQASENYLKQFNEIKKWLGTKGNYPTRNQHEKFARAYEKYIYNGTYAKSPIGDVFGEYENFIREVYSDISEIDTRAGEKKYKPIPRVVYNFFDSMVSGKLPGVIIDDEPKKEVEKDEKEVREFIKEENKILEENRANYTLKPVQTDTKTGYLTAYEKMTGEQVEAGSMELKDQMEKAENFVANNLEQAERIVNGLEQAPEGIVKNAVYVAYNNLQKKLGNTDKRANSMLNQALELRRMGQEIASQRLAYADVEGEASATFWIKEVIKNKAEALADANGLTVTELSDKIDNAISDGIANNKKPEDIVKQLGEELGVTEFYQTEVLSGFGNVDTYAHSYIKRYVNERLGLGMSKTEAETIIRKADDMLASLQNSMSKTGNPSVDYFVKLKDMENYANSLAPSSEMRVAMSVIGRGNLLASIKSPVTNIVSNLFTGAFRAGTRRINLGVTNSIVSPELIKQNRAYSWEIFDKTGYNVNNITKDKPRNLILGEKLTHSEGKGFIRGLGRLYEKTVYKWGLGAGDVVFKDYAFTDYVALKATKLANGDVAKANKIFEDACLIEPKTKEGAEIRQEAIQESLIATYQNNSAISEGALKVRKTMDFGVGFGEFIAPFVKTPANVVSMGLKSGFGSVEALFSEIKKGFKTISRLQKENPNKSVKEIMEMEEFKNAIKPTQENIDLFVQNGLGILLAFALMSAIDDDDYMPPYALASSKDKQLAKELNIPYNAIRINAPWLGLDNTWVSLDYLGVLASPLMGLLQARRENGIINSMFGYVKSAGIQALSIPAFGEVADIFENIKNSVRKDGVDAFSVAGGELLEQAYARVVPSIVSDVAKALDSYDRETKGAEIRTKIPLARETADKRVSATTGKAEKLGNPVFDILFGARVKEQVSNPVADELLRLNNAGWGVSLTTVTRSGLLSELDEETKQKVREDFATEYSKEVSRLIKSFRYSKADDEEKQDMINKIRRDIISKLKKRYLKNRK